MTSEEKGALMLRDEFYCGTCGEAMRAYGFKMPDKEELEWRTIHNCGLPPGYDGPPVGSPGRIVQLKRTT